MRLRACKMEGKGKDVCKGEFRVKNGGLGSKKLSNRGCGLV